MQEGPVHLPHLFMTVFDTEAPSVERSVDRTLWGYLWPGVGIWGFLGGSDLGFWGSEAFLAGKHTENHEGCARILVPFAEV